MSKTRRAKPGDYVFATKWTDGTPNDPWYIGFVSCVLDFGGDIGRYRYWMKDDKSRTMYKFVRKLTKEQGTLLLKMYTEASEYFGTDLTIQKTMKIINKEIKDGQTKVRK